MAHFSRQDMAEFLERRYPLQCHGCGRPRDGVQTPGCDVCATEYTGPPAPAPKGLRMALRAAWRRVSGR